MRSRPTPPGHLPQTAAAALWIHHLPPPSSFVPQGGDEPVSPPSRDHSDHEAFDSETKPLPQDTTTILLLRCYRCFAHHVQPFLGKLRCSVAAEDTCHSAAVADSPSPPFIHTGNSQRLISLHSLEIAERDALIWPWQNLRLASPRLCDTHLCSDVARGFW